MSLLESLKAKFADLYAREPARVNAAITTAVVALVTLTGLVVVGPGLALGVAAVVAFLVPELVAELTRPKVMPMPKVEELVSDTAMLAMEPDFEDLESDLGIKPPPDPLGP